MTKSTILHITLLGLTAAVLAACSSKTTPPVSTTTQPTVALPTGQRMPEGTVINPTGSPASYKAVDFLAMPQWQEQNFINSLESFKKVAASYKTTPTGAMFANKPTTRHAPKLPLNPSLNAISPLGK